MQIPLNTPVGRLRAHQWAAIKRWAENEALVGSDLHQAVTNNIGRLEQIGCYKALQHRGYLSTRGRRIRSNWR
ncbi:MAG: hypothetical protein ACKER6_01080 [Candidatus Hodgkinia cicadicola]